MDNNIFYFLPQAIILKILLHGIVQMSWTKKRQEKNFKLSNYAEHYSIMHEKHFIFWMKICFSFLAVFHIKLWRLLYANTRYKHPCLFCLNVHSFLEVRDQADQFLCILILLNSTYIRGWHILTGKIKAKFL